MHFKLLPALLVLLNANIVGANPSSMFAREQIRVVGSSTVFPFVSAAAENFGRFEGYPTPIVESTGTGGGFKLFCGGVGETFPDMSNASRAIKDSEIKLCAQHGVHEPIEIEIGADGIVLANSKHSSVYNLTMKQLFLALAKDVPVDGVLAKNPYRTWKDLDASLPNKKIEIFGPPPTSGTRDAFVEIVMETMCKKFPEYEKAYPDKDVRKEKCKAMREDGGFIDAGENDNLIVKKLVANPDALGIFGFGFLEENASLVQGSLIDNVTPEFENITNKSYPVARSLFVYIKREHLDKVRGLREFMKELTSDEAASEEGYMAEAGLIPLTKTELKRVQSEISALQRSAKNP